MLDGGANVCCIGSTDMSIVFKPERLENSRAHTTWFLLTLDPDRRAHIEEDLIRRPSKVSVFSLRDAPISIDIWHARLGHRSYAYLEAMK